MYYQTYDWSLAAENEYGNDSYEARAAFHSMPDDGYAWHKDSIYMASVVYEELLEYYDADALPEYDNFVGFCKHFKVDDDIDLRQLYEDVQIIAKRSFA